MIQSLLYTIAQPMKVKIPHRPIHIVVFLLLCFLCYEAHQLTLHLVGAALCGGFGSMTFLEMHSCLDPMEIRFRAQPSRAFR